jgi:hypothetical protein
MKTSRPFSTFSRIALCLLAIIAAACNDSGDGATGERGAVLCSDDLDNDADGFKDCADQDCWAEASCLAPDASNPGDSNGGADTASTPDTTAVDDTETPDTTTPQPIGCDPCGIGSITGRACAPSATAAVSQATVTVSGIGCDGNPFTLTATSGADGNFNFPAVPCGTHTLTIERGSFRRDVDVMVANGRNTNLGEGATKACFQAAAARVAVLAGTWDHMQDLLTRLGIAFDLYTDDGTGAAGEIVALLSDSGAMAAYDIIFANCGHTHGNMPKDHPAVMANVRDFILEGGSFYMSDYAWTYGEWAFPDAIEFQRSDDVLDMYSERSPQLIPSDQRVNARVVDGNLAAFLGAETLEVHFDSGPQIATEKVGTAFAHVVADFPAILAVGTDFQTRNVPLVISYRPAAGAGRVVYTNFHNDAQTTADMMAIMTYLVFSL